MKKFDKKYFDDELHLANTSAIVSAEPAISGNFIQRFIKKIIKKCIDFYIGESVGKQNEFNVHVVNVLNDMNAQLLQNDDDDPNPLAQYEKLILENECEITKLKLILNNKNIQAKIESDVNKVKGNTSKSFFGKPDDADAAIIKMLDECEKKHVAFDLSSFRHDFTSGCRAELDGTALEKERNENFSSWDDCPHFSILTPVYNVRLCYMAELLCSVIDQTYPYFELCLADGSDEQHHDVERLIRAVARTDSRIKYKKIQNKGISDNTNEALKLAGNEWIALLDHDDLLHPSALYFVAKKIISKKPDVVYTDECVFKNILQNVVYCYQKTGYEPDDLITTNYMNHLTVFKRSLIEKETEEKVWNPSLDGAQDHDFVLRLSEKTENIVHIPYMLYYWRRVETSASYNADQNSPVYQAGLKAVQEHLDRVSPGASASVTKFPGYYRIQYPIYGEPFVSIVILNKDSVEMLKKCIDSIISKTTWKNYEIIVCENGSKRSETFAYYEQLVKEDIAHVLLWPKDKEFNFAAINNWGVKQSHGDYVLLLNSDIEVITPDWIEEMLMLAQRDNTGIVGSMLLYPNGTIQHAGCVVLQNGANIHVDRFRDPKEVGYCGRNVRISDMPAVTGACMMLKRDVWDELEGMDERLAVAYNDIDLCIRARKLGKLVVYTPYAKLFHYEGFTRGFRRVNRNEIEREAMEQRLFVSKHGAFLVQDKYYNPNLSLDGLFQEQLNSDKEHYLYNFFEQYENLPIVFASNDIDDYIKKIISKTFDDIYVSTEDMAGSYLYVASVPKQEFESISETKIVEDDEEKIIMDAQSLKALKEEYLSSLGDEYIPILKTGNAIICGRGIFNSK